MAGAFITLGVVFLVLAVFLMVRHEPELAGLVNGTASACLLAAGIIGHFKLTIALGAVGVALNFIGLGGPRRRKRVKRVLGNKSSQLRDGLARQMRRRRVARRRWSPSPSPSR